jgi:hypothetical protein
MQEEGDVGFSTIREPRRNSLLIHREGSGEWGRRVVVKRRRSCRDPVLDQLGKDQSQKHFSRIACPEYPGNSSN